MRRLWRFLVRFVAPAPHLSPDIAYWLVRDGRRGWDR
jgi:hypothetical protein